MAEIDWSKATDDYLDGPNLQPPLGPRLVTNVGIASEIDSDYEAELKKVATATGVPVDVVRSDPEAAKRKAIETSPELVALPSQSPKTAKYVADNAAMAHDDIPALKFVEQRIAAITDLAKSSGMGLAEGLIGFAGAFNDIIDPLGLFVGTGSQSRAYADNTRQQLDKKIKETMPQTSNVWEAGVNSGVVSLFQQSPMLAASILTRNPNLALAGMGAVTGGEAYGEAKDKGKSNLEALSYGVAQGGVEVLTEKRPMNALIGDVAAGTGLFKTIAKQFALDVPGEQVATALQDLNEWAVLNPDRPFQEYLRDRPNAALQTAIATVVGTGGMVTTAKVTDMVMRQADRQRSAAKGLAEGKMLAEMDAAAAESKLRLRDADSFKAFIDQAVEEGGPVENVYVPGETLAQAIADNIEAGGDAASITAMMPSVQDQLTEAVRTGGDVQIPLSEWMAFASGSELSQTLLPHLKTDPLGMSQAQAQVFMQESAQEMEAEVQAIVAASEQVDAFQASANAVQAQVADQLAKANRFTPDVNDAYAQLTAGFYATMAQRIGVTPEELYAANPVEIAAQGVELGSLAQIPPDVAARLDYETKLPDVAEFAEAVANTPAATLTPEGLRIKLVRNQKEEQHGALSVRTGVFYLPKGSPNARYYSKTGPGQYYGGSERVEGETLIKAPLFVKGATGGKAPEVAYETINGKGSFKKLEADIMHVVGGSAHLKREGLLEEAVDRLLSDYGADPSIAYELIQNSSKGNQLRYALQENIIAHAVRAAGYDSVVGYSKGKNGATISEVFDVREGSYPSPEGDFELHPDFQALLNQSARPAETPAEFSARMVETHDLRDFDLRETSSGDLELNHIAAPTGQQGEGKGSAAMADLVAYADANGKRILLTPQSRDDGKGSTSTKRLTSFYKRFGFKENKGRSRDFSTTAGMIREPQTLRQEGQPIFHGSNRKGLTTLQPSDRGALGPGVYLTPNENVARRYGDAVYSALEPAGIFNGLGSRDSRINPYEVWRNQVAQLTAAATPEQAAEINEISARMQPADGYPFFKRVAQVMGSEEAAQDLFKRAGFKGISGFADGPEIVVFNPVDVAALEQAARGSYNPGSDVITLLKGADLSTFLHESGHFYIETLARLAAQPNAPEQIAEDFATAATFMGHDGVSPSDWLMMPLDERREGHELFARGFEAYLFEGKAPAQRLRQIYRRFRSWLVNVYKNLTALNVELSDEVRGVFDRMLATDAEIERQQAASHYNPLFTDPETAGMTEAEWESYQRLGREATEEAVEQLEARSLRDMQWLTNARSRALSELQREARSKRKAVEAEVTEEVMAEPVNQARTLLKRGMLNGQEFDGPHKLSIPALEEMYADMPPELRDYKRLGYGKYGMLAADGVHPDEIADLFGFGSGDALVEQLLNAEQPAVTIEGLTDQRMLERYGDLADPDGISRAANEAIHNEARLRFAATEANALAKAAGSRRVLASAAKEYAATMVARMKVRDLRPSRFAAAESRAAIAAERAMRDGDLPLAASAKRAQVVNGYATRATQEAQTEVERALRYFAGFSNASSRKSIDPDYRDQIDQLLARFDLRKGISLRAIDKRKSLAAWVEAQKEQGLDPIIPDELLNETFNKHYKDMTIEELRGLVDSVRNIAHLGRLKNRLLTAKDRREFEATVEEGRQIIAANSGREARDAVEANTWSDKAASGAREFLAMHRKFASLIRQMGGFKDRGLLWDVLVRPMNEAADKEAVMREQSTMALHEIFGPIVKAGKTRQKISVPGLGQSLSLEGRLAIALNWGNELNRQRIMDGDRWTEEQVNAILGTLSAEHWTFVQKVWDYLDSYWPEIAAKERRVTGVEPQKVDRLPFTVVSSDGVEIELSGGYYPLKYDTRRSTKAEADETAEAIRQSMQGAYTRATTRRGHTKQRAERVDRPVRKDFGVIFEHATQVIHDLSWHEYLIDANRLIGAGGLDTVIRAHYGPEVLKTMRSALNDMAAGDIPATNAFERSVNHLRTGATIAGLGWNLTTALLQPLGLTQSVVRIGPKWVGRGIARIVGDAAAMQNSVEWVNERSSFMRLRSKTMQREISEIRNRVTGSKPEALTTVESSFFYLIGKFQLIADMPTWMGAYEKAKDQGENDDTAVALADQAVRDAQGGGAISDLSQIQRGSPLMKLWTNFYSFFNVAYNMLAESVNETRVAGPKRLPLLAADVLLLMVLPSVLGTILRNAMRGDDWDELPEDLLKDQLGYMFGLMVGLREVGSMIAMPGNYSSISGLRFATELGKLIEQTGQGEVDEAFLKRANNTAGILFHYPAGQVQRTTLGIQALWDGKSKNPMVVVTGPPRERP